jgi:TolA-binding protein
VHLEPKARARVTEVAATGATVRVESGRANVSVVKRAHAAWRVSLGPFRVEVTGTRFDVDWDPANDRLFLRMHEGSVVVSGCVFGSGRPVGAGETVRASCREPNLEISTKKESSKDSKAPSGTEASSEKPTVLDHAPAASGSERGSPTPSGSIATTGGGSDWRELVRNGRHAEALEAAEAAGFSAQCASASAADLVALGDAGRYAGRIDRAIEAYQAVRRRFAGSERSAVAAFALGRIAFDQRGDYADAARWFKTYLAEQPGGRLDRDASGRLMESLNRSGDAVGARSVAKQYLERYPTGPHAEMAHRLTGE